MAGTTFGSDWSWFALLLLGAYHGINPGMGWLFAVARGMQERTTQAVARAIIPITLGHALSIGLVVALAGLVQVVVPLGYVQWIVALALISLGMLRLLRRKHFAWGGMQVGFRDLTFWSFLMASAHGAGLMVLPILLHSSSSNTRAANNMPAGHQHHMHMARGVGVWAGVGATLVHTFGYVAITAVVALLVYRRFGLAMLRKAWFNLDFVWAIALIITGTIALIA